MLQKTYDWTMSLAAHPRALWALAIISFAESSFFPIPPDVLLLPMVLANRDKALLYAFVCTVASVAGGLFGYGIGMLAFDQVGQPILSMLGKEAAFANFSQYYNDWGIWIVSGAAFTPIPYKVVTIASGTTGLDLIGFTLASFLGRGARFFAVTILLYYFGVPIREFIEKRLGLVTLAAFALLLGGFLFLKVL